MTAPSSRAAPTGALLPRTKPATAGRTPEVIGDALAPSIDDTHHDAIRGRASPENVPWLLKPEEAARLLSLSRSRLYELIGCGEIPSITIGASRRIRRDQLWRWIEGQSQ